MSKFLKSAPVRKGRAFLNRIPRAAARLRADRSDYHTAPPILVNSLPKSGTHLLMQIAECLPNTRQYGTFLAQTPSLTLRYRSQREVNRHISRFAPGEIIGAHLHHSAATADKLREKNVFHMFIWRDPRDVVLSEAHYLAEMNRFHAMHRKFKSMPSTEARVELAITGAGDNYPDVGMRIMPYMPWTTQPGTIALRYEALVDPDTQLQVCRDILAAYATHCGVTDGMPTPQDLVDAIVPQNSHTFNKGGIGRWKSEMNPKQQKMCEERLGDWLHPGTMN